MEKLYLWYNPNINQFYYKLCRNCGTKVGNVNQYNDLLCTTLTLFDKKIYANLTNLQCYKIMAKKRDNRYLRLLNRLKDF